MARNVTTALWGNLMLDLMPDSPAQAMDFGVRSQEHYGALQHAVKTRDMSAEELDPYCGDGPALTRLCAETEGQPYQVTFVTPWDDMPPEEP